MASGSRTLSDGAARREAAYEKLSPGPGMAASDVAVHQGERTYGAVVDLIAEQRGGPASVRAITQRAGVSTRTFYELFDGKEDCLLQTHEYAVVGIARRLVEAQAEGVDWLERLRCLLREWARVLRREPGVVRLILIEVHALDLRAEEHAKRGESVLETMLASCFPGNGRANAGSSAVKATLAGVIGVSRAYLLTGQIPPSSVGDDLADWASSLYVVSHRQSVPRSTQETWPEEVSSAKQSEEQQPTNDRVLVLAATGKLIAAGRTDLTVNEICRASGVSHRAFRSHFTDVDSCVLATVRSHLEAAIRWSSKGGQVDDAPSPERATQCLSNLQAYVSDDPLLSKLCSGDLQVSPLARIRCNAEAVKQIACLLGAFAPRTASTNITELATAAAIFWSIQNQNAKHVSEVDGNNLTATSIAGVLYRPEQGVISLPECSPASTLGVETVANY